MTPQTTYLTLKVIVFRVTLVKVQLEFRGRDIKGRVAFDVLQQLGKLTLPVILYRSQRNSSTFGKLDEKISSALVFHHHILSCGQKILSSDAHFLYCCVK